MMSFEYKLLEKAFMEIIIPLMGRIMFNINKFLIKRLIKIIYLKSKQTIKKRKIMTIRIFTWIKVYKLHKMSNNRSKITHKKNAHHLTDNQTPR